MKSEGTIATSVARKGGRGMAVDRKASFMVQEFRKFGIVRPSDLGRMCTMLMAS